MKYWCSPPRRRADHEDQDVVLFNRAMLPAYYGILRMCCQQSRTFTRQLAQHQNMQWAFKNITPYPAQYTAVRPLLYTRSFLTHSPPSRQWYVLFCTCTPFSHIPCPIHCGTSSLVHILISHTFPAQYTVVCPLLYTYSFLTHSLPNTPRYVLSCTHTHFSHIPCPIHRGTSSRTHTPFSHIPCPIHCGTSSLVHILLSHTFPAQYTAVCPLLYTYSFLTHSLPNTLWYVLSCTHTPFSHIPCPIHCGTSSLIHVLLSHTFPAQYTVIRPLLYTYSFLTHSLPNTQWYVLSYTRTSFSHIPCPIHCGMSSLIHVLLSHTFPAQYTVVCPLLYTYSFLTHSLPSRQWYVLSYTRTPFSHIPCPVDSGTSSLIHVLLSHTFSVQ